jgi:hypothetical protein
MPADPPFNALIPPTPAELKERRQALAEVEAQLMAQMDDLIANILSFFGDEEGRRIWIEKARKPRRGGRRPRRDWLLLRVYDVTAAQPGANIKGLPERVAKMVKDNPHPALGDLSMVGEDGIAKRIRRALGRRAKTIEASRGNPLSWASPDK